MPYIPHLNTIVLEIPKSGSSTLVKAASTLGPITHRGHLQASAYGIQGARIIAVVRDPVDRLISALNYYYDPQPVDDVLRHALRYRVGQVAFKSQEWFMDVDGIEVYPLNSIGDALASVGYVGEVPRENAKRKWLTLGTAKKSKYWPTLCLSTIYKL